MNGCRRVPGWGSSAGPGTRRRSGCTTCDGRWPRRKSRSPSSGRRGRCGAPSGISGRTGRTWARSCRGCAAPSTPASASWWPSRPMPERGGFEGLDACVHCGFCLQACPTFLATGDEADSPRGRIELMRTLELGLLSPTDPDLALHLDRCLGCRGCEPVCPSGVAYGRGLEAARDHLTRARGVPWLARLALWTLTTPGISAVAYALARLLRATGLPRTL